MFQNRNMFIVKGVRRIGYLRQKTLTEAQLLNNPEEYFRSVDLKSPTLVEMKSIAQETQIAIKTRLAKHKTTYPTYLRPLQPDILTNCEGKKNIVIEIGGTNMRAILWGVGKNGKLIPINGGPIFQEKLSNKSEEKKSFESTDAYFDYLFQSLPGLFTLIKANPDALLSIIFSFPGQPIEGKNGLDYKIGPLRKGLKVKHLEKNNFIPLLNKYLENKYRITPRKMVLFNDTAVLLEDNIGLVVGTGYNFALKMMVVQLREIFGPKFAPSWKNNDWMVVNLEAGSIGVAQKYAGARNRGSIFNRIDRSDRPGTAQDEKIVSGLYLSRALQFALEDLNKITVGKAVGKLDQNIPIEAEHISMILNDDWSGDISAQFSDDKQSKLYLPFSVNGQYRAIVKQVCEIIRDTSAKVVASMLVGGLDLTGETKLEANVEGSLFWHMPSYKRLVVKYIKQLKGADFPIEIKNAKERKDNFSAWGSLYYGGLAGLQYFYNAEQRLS